LKSSFFLWVWGEKKKAFSWRGAIRGFHAIGVSAARLAFTILGRTRHAITLLCQDYGGQAITLLRQDYGGQAIKKKFI